jgi:transposase
MKKYDRAFKREAISKINDGQSVASLARALGVSEVLLYKWKKEAVESASDSEREIIELKKRLREVEMERDILKNVWLRRRRQPFPANSAQGRTDATNVSGFFDEGFSFEP